MVRELPPLVSIHDVTPQTLSQVIEIVSIMDTKGLPPAVLLIVCGEDWTAPDLDTLRVFSDKGHELAGHGWSHTAGPVCTLRHRLYAAALSRGCAEHLDKPPSEVREIILRTYGWFGNNGLPEPSLYVPPAWAMGNLRLSDLRQLPYRWYETLRGIYDSETGRWHILPAVGFEADSTLRQAVLTLLNSANSLVSQVLKLPLRIAIHPADMDLKLAGQLTGIYLGRMPRL